MIFGVHSPQLLVITELVLLTNKLKWHFDNNSPLSTNICLLFSLYNNHNLCIFLIYSGGSAKMIAEGQASQRLRNCFPLQEQQLLQFSQLWQCAFLGSHLTPTSQVPGPEHQGPDPALASVQVQQWKSLHAALSLSLVQGSLRAAMVNKPGDASTVLAVGECVCTHV